MTRPAPIPETVSVHVPFRITKRGGRKEMVLPAGGAASRPRVDNAMIKALARAFRWRKLLDTGGHATVEDIARAEKIDTSYVSRVLRMSLLAPEIVEAILEGRQGEGVMLGRLMEPFRVEWEGQMSWLHRYRQASECGSHPLPAVTIYGYKTNHESQ